MPNYNNNSRKNGGWKPDDSEGDYDTNHIAKTFSRSFYYINFLDKNKKYDPDYSEKFDDKSHAHNKAAWYTRNTWALSSIPYQVKYIGVYDSKKGHVETFSLF